MNRLASESSLYLRQHADNPVDWYPWGEEALELARREDRPILLSIGYSACHWCHVMARESFSDPDIATLMNRHFVNIKVDREERPDLDRIYQAAHQAITRRRGGWPLTMFLDPRDQVPFFGGTYFPPDNREGLPGFAELLDSLVRLFTERRDALRGQNQRLVAFLDTSRGAGNASRPPGSSALAAAVERLAQHHDREWGGFGDAPKFPQPPTLRLLQVASPRVDERLARLAGAMRRSTLHSMGSGGLCDHVGGGFFRYCVDRRWTIPHFEKMLYDNALLLPIYAREAADGTAPAHAATARMTADWLCDDMQSAAGGFYASVDADSEGQEGRYYLWTDDELDAALPAADLEAAREAFAARGEPNFEGRAWHLQRRETTASLANRLGRRPGELATTVDAARRTLLEARRARVAPTTDRKIITSWNALAIDGLAQASMSLGEPGWLEAAVAGLERLSADCFDGDRLVAVAGSTLGAYLDDHAFLLCACLTALEAEWDERWLTLAVRLADELLERFQDTERGGFYFTAVDHEPLMQRPKSFEDEALPNGNGMAVEGLLELGRLLGEARYLEAAEAALRAAAPIIARAPHACSSMLAGWCEWDAPTPQLVLRGKADGPISLDGVRCYRIPDDSSLAGLYPLQGPFSAYLCDSGGCSSALASASEVMAAAAGAAVVAER